MYHVGTCKVCRQGVLEILKDVKEGRIFICCDECLSEWDNPRDAIADKNYIETGIERAVTPTLEEINKMNWGVNIYEIDD